MRHILGYLNLFPIVCFILKKNKYVFQYHSNKSLNKFIRFDGNYLFGSFEITSIMVYTPLRNAGYTVCTTWLRLFLHEPNTNCDQSWNIVKARFIGGGKRSTQGKPRTCRKSLTNCITECCIEYIWPWTWFELTTFVVIGTNSCKSNYHTTMITTKLS